ncbi:MAG: peptidoglycan-binding domain-containing protein [Paracoccaceae bacterium]
MKFVLKLLGSARFAFLGLATITLLAISSYSAEARSAQLDRGQILLAQESLTILGFAPGERNGIYGAQTARAVYRYQSAMNQTPTGELTVDQYYSLVTSVSEGQLSELRRMGSSSGNRIIRGTSFGKAADRADGDSYSGYGTMMPSGKRCTMRPDLCEAGWD